MVSTWQQTNFTTQTVAQYPALIDGDIAVATRVADAFAPHQQNMPNMAVELDPGFLFDPRNANLTSVAAQSTGLFVAPVSQPRVDRVVVDAGTGAVSFVTGTEAAMPVPPAIPGGKMPVAQVLLQPGSTAITNAMIMDERGVWGPPVPGLPWATAGGSSDAITASYAPANAALYDGLLLSFRASAANTTATPSFAPDGLTAYVITKEGGQSLTSADIPGALAECILRFNAANTRWELLNPQQGIVSVAAGMGIGISESSGTVTINNTGVTSLGAGTGVSVSAATGGVTVTNTGVTSLTNGAGIGVSASTGGVTVTNTGVTSLAGGTGVSVSAASGGITIINTGVTSIIAGSGIGVSSSSGVVTISSTSSPSPFSATFTSSLYGWGSQTIPHGLGAIPFGVTLIGKKVGTAGFDDFPVGTLIYNNGFFTVTGSGGGDSAFFNACQIRADATNIYVDVLTEGGPVLYIIASGETREIVNSSWNWFVQAWV